ncbi:fluoride efflux transporter CrcB [candidate division KSB3 bacterium]|uniref:Fluoride-specific ion channel FluC n=1 Tax=candidate division KSB3 bacterium TaxID=2044937 RepID=A0A2G6E880_9BACT|nr:MAG: fluoride efflux transporter CrcB [candidate division KSB3 bacterium]PIE30548.1 MAG: fluoride efflux transporter CrcB [candidate division KSB3 bacterium]
MLKILCIGSGGFIGASCRYFVSAFIQRIPGFSCLSCGTFVVNMLGCFLIGFLSGLAESRQIFSPEFRLFLFIGFLGSFTTFSTFNYEVFLFVQGGQFFTGALVISLQVFVGLGLVWAGNLLACLI